MADLCDLLGIERPVLLAPMAKIAGGALASAVSDAGGLGILGGGYGDTAWLDEQAKLTGDSRVGIGLITWNMSETAVADALAYKPAALWLSFGEPAPHIPLIHEAGAVAICQVASLNEAMTAIEAGADVIVAQGSESGGHGRSGRSLFGLLPAIRAAAPEIPLVAAGGISDAAGFEAARALGADGVALGTALYATNEARDADAAKQRLVTATGDDTIRCTLYDKVRGPDWPEGYDGRCVRTDLTDEWAGREHELTASELEPMVAQHTQAATDADMSIRVLWAGEGLDAITEIRPAAEVVQQFSR